MAEKSYAFAVGNIRARENRLLKQSDIEQILSFNSAYACAAFLKDKGYGENGTDGSVSSLLSSEEKKLWSYIKELAPDFSVFDAFIVANDFHKFSLLARKKRIKKCISGSRGCEKHEKREGPAKTGENFLFFPFAFSLPEVYFPSQNGLTGKYPS